MNSDHSSISKKIFSGHIVSRLFEDDICYLKIKVDGDFTFRPGQYVWVVIGRHNEQRQAFSIADYSDDKKEITIIFNKGVSDFKVKLQESQLNFDLKIIGPFGQSIAFEKDEKKTLNLYAGNVGIAPFLALIKYHSTSKSSTKINLKYFTSKDTPMIVEMLSSYQSLNPNFIFKIINRGINFDVKPSNNSLYCVVGSQEFVDYISSILKTKGVSNNDMIFEQFHPSSFWRRKKYNFQENDKNEFSFIRESLISKFIPWMILMGLIFSLFSGIQFYLHGVLTSINVFTIIILAFLMIYWSYTKNTRVISFVIVIIGTLLVLYGLILDPSSKFAIFWLPLVPVLNFIFLGLRAVYWNLFFLIVMYSYFSLVFLGIVPTGHEFLELINTIMATTFITIMIYLNSIVDNIRRNGFQNLIDKTSIFRQAIESSSNHVVTTDENGSILFANKAAQRITGFDFNEMINNTPRLWGGEMSDDFYKTLWYKKTTGGNFEGEITNRRKDGFLYTALAHISPIKSNGEVLGYIGTEEDITKLKELDKLKDEFVSLASHELRTPMTAIKGFVSMILDGDYGKFTNDLVDPLKSIQTSTERLINLVNDLLNLSRIESGRLKINLGEIDVSKLSKEALDSLKPIADGKKIKLSFSGQERLLVQADSDKFRQVLINLVGNSLKFTDKGSITVKGVLQKEFVKVSVIDTGIGIAKEDQTRIFGKFEQITNSVKGRPQGTGLGLYICKMIIEKMGGVMWLEDSNVGAGSTFSFTLPAVGSNVALKVKDEVGKEAKINPDQKDMAVNT